MLVCLCGSFMVRMEGVQRKDRVGLQGHSKKDVKSKRRSI